MRMSAAIDVYIGEMVAEGRFNSRKTEDTYRATLLKHAEDVGNRDPSKTGRDDVKRTLVRWGHPNSRAVHRSHLVSFYDWCLENGHRKDNPARQTRRPRGRKSNVYRLTRDEVRAFRAAARGDRERRIADFGLLTGLRAAELLGLQGRHLRREGWVWVSEDIGKGHKFRWVYVLPELQETFFECRETVGDSEYVLARRTSNLQGMGRVDVLDPSRPMAYESLYRAVQTIGRRAGIRARVTPHMLRHAYGDHIARYGGLKVAQFLLGHASVSTTEVYTGAPTLDEVADAVAEFGFGEARLPAADRAAGPLVVAGARLHLDCASGGPERDLDLGEFPEVLRWLFAHPTIRKAARAMGEVADAR